MDGWIMDGGKRTDTVSSQRLYVSRIACHGRKRRNWSHCEEEDEEDDDCDGFWNIESFHPVGRIAACCLCDGVIAIFYATVFVCARAIYSL